LEAAEEVLVSAITWVELAWLARHERITLDVPIRSWLEELSTHVRPVGLTPAIADLAVSLPRSFPGDPMDRVIYATAIEHGVKLVTKDRAITKADRSRSLVVW
jgi:PIN domain nuclease of toxin-antitoxin system